MKKLKVIFCGTPDFAIPSLEMLFNHPMIEIIKVISKISRPVGRGLKITEPPVIQYAIKEKIPYIQTENINNDPIVENFFKENPFDVLLVLAFSQFLNSKILNIPKIGAFNIHASLLPRHRGAAPIQYSLIAGDSKTGVCIQKMVKKMDAGDVGPKIEVSISPNESATQLSTRLKFASALLVSDFINRLLLNEIDYYPQDETRVTFAPILTKEKGHLDFKNFEAYEIHNLTRALNPWPGTYLFFNNKRIKILETQITGIQKNISPNEVFIDSGRIYIGCKKGIIQITKLQLEGKRAMNDHDFLQGHRELLNITNN